MASQGLEINSIIRLLKPYYGLAHGLINSHGLVPGPNDNHRLVPDQNVIHGSYSANHITTWLMPSHSNNNMGSNSAKISKGLTWKTTKQPRQPGHGRSLIRACSWYFVANTGLLVEIILQSNRVWDQVYPYRHVVVCNISLGKEAMNGPYVTKVSISRRNPLQAFLPRWSIPT
jgi:hypothetical protein